MITTLKAQLGEKVSTVPLALEAHGQDKSYPQVYPPLAVVFAETAGVYRRSIPSRRGSAST